jgi:hypothetical protein
VPRPGDSSLEIEAPGLLSGGFFGRLIRGCVFCFLVKLQRVVRALSPLPVSLPFAGGRHSERVVPQRLDPLRPLDLIQAAHGSPDLHSAFLAHKHPEARHRLRVELVDA